MYKTGPDGQPLKNPDGTFVLETPVVVSVQSPDTSLATQLAAARAHSDRLEQELRRNEDEKRLRALQNMSVDQQVTARMQETERQVAQVRAEMAQRDAHNQTMISQVGLMAYRERALQDVPPQVRNLIPTTLSSEQEIDQYVARTSQMVQQIEAQYAQQAQTQIEAERTRQAQQVGYAYPAAPPNPAFVAPFTVAPFAGGFPTVTNPTPVPAQAEPTAQDMQHLTNEQSVRSGKYSGELREQMHARLRATMQYTGNLGTTPRHLLHQPNALPQQQLPNGVVQPYGTPMGPVTPQAMPQGNQAPQWMSAQPQHVAPAPNMIPPGMEHIQMQPQYPQPIAPMPQYPGPITQPGQAPTAPQQQWAPPAQGGQTRAAAMMAVQGTHSGTNAAMGPAATTALAEANSYAQRHNISSPAAAFSQRFSPSGEN